MGRKYPIFEDTFSRHFMYGDGAIGECYRSLAGLGSTWKPYNRRRLGLILSLCGGDARLLQQGFSSGFEMTVAVRDTAAKSRCLNVAWGSYDTRR